VSVADTVNSKPLMAAVTDFLCLVGHIVRDCAIQSDVRILGYTAIKCKPVVTNKKSEEVTDVGVTGYYRD
jgi:hypothetical protein